MNDGAKIPVTVLTGFLGSGKTTLVNHILTANHGHRIAVIENEFGDVPIDNDLVLTGEEEIIEMSNGCCLCCTARTDLIDILRALLAREDRFDRVLIETSGMADPNPVAQTFFVDDEITANFELDGIVTLVDSAHAPGHIDEGGTGGVGAHVTDQIAFADRVILNKTDLVAPSAVDGVERRVRGINSTADIIRSSYADVELERILGIGAFTGERRDTDDAQWLHGDGHLHDPTLTSVSIEIDAAVDRSMVSSWVTRLLEERGADVYRIKGILAVRDDDRRFVLQGMHTIFDIQPGALWAGDGQRASRIVLIGRDLDHVELSEGLRGCAVDNAKVLVQ